MPRRQTLPSDALLLALSSAIAYVVAYSFELGYLSWYGITADFLELSVERIIVAWTTLFLVFVSLVIGLGPLPVMPWRPLIDRGITLITVGLCWWEVTKIIRDHGFNWWTILMAVFLALTSLIWFTGSILPLLKQPGLLNEKLEAMDARDRMAIARRERLVMDWFVEIAPYGRSFWVMLSLVVAAFVSAGLLGRLFAASQMHYLVSATPPECAVVRRYSDHLLCLEFNRQRGQFGHVLRVLPVASDDGNSFRLELLDLDSPVFLGNGTDTHFF